MAFTLTLVSDPTSHERVEGTFSVTDGGVLTVQEQGRAPRIYSTVSSRYSAAKDT